ncbi:hypothetical protein BDZ94DRAFT_1158196 [Collybia nuda]|uniref:Uncharacterized protein n=1 Tax=Collybia nuda TaxID=64659 RepID=A0A9P6CHP4_9AGAR|nr:hypothetical protein BDZ94DRAFT_1158196 [Collybia nuda]
MGANQSSPEGDVEKVFQSETPISFSQDVVNQLSDKLDSTRPSSERQSTLDGHIRARIQSELAHLKQEEENVQREIEQALEKENLDREREMAGGAESESEGDGIGSVKSSVALLGDLEEVRSKVDRYQARRELEQFPEVKVSGEAVVECYKNNMNTPLDCWREVENFKTSVAGVERASNKPYPVSKFLADKSFNLQQYFKTLP